MKRIIVALIGVICLCIFVASEYGESLFGQKIVKTINGQNMHDVKRATSTPSLNAGRLNGTDSNNEKRKSDTEKKNAQKESTTIEINGYKLINLEISDRSAKYSLLSFSDSSEVVFNIGSDEIIKAEVNNRSLK